MGRRSGPVALMFRAGEGWHVRDVAAPIFGFNDARAEIVREVTERVTVPTRDSLLPVDGLDGLAKAARAVHLAR